MAVLETKSRIGYYEKHYLVIPDEAAGKFRYTVYEIPSSPSRRIRVLGRELDLRTARKLVCLASAWQAKLRTS